MASLAKVICATSLIVLATSGNATASAQNGWLLVRQIPRDTSIRVSVDAPDAPAGRVELVGTFRSSTPESLTVEVKKSDIDQIIETPNRAVVIIEGQGRLEPLATTENLDTAEITVDRDVVRRVSGRVGNDHRLLGGLIGAGIAFAAVTAFGLSSDSFESDDEKRVVSIGFGLFAAPGGFAAGYFIGKGAMNWDLVYERSVAEESYFLLLSRTTAERRGCGDLARYRRNREGPGLRAQISKVAAEIIAQTTNDCDEPGR